MSAPTDEACVSHLRRIDAALRAGDPRAALQDAQALLAEDHTPPWRVGELCALAAEAAEAVGLRDAAEGLWRHAALKATTVAAAANALANLGALLATQRRFEAAEAAGRDALELEPDHVPALANLALLLADTRRTREAETLYRRALSLDPHNARTLSNFGVLLTGCKRFDEAEPHLRRALELAPDLASAHSNLGLLLQDTSRARDAEAHHRRAAALAPQSAEIQSNLGNLLASLDRFDEAEAALRRALVLDPTWAPVHNNLGVLLADRHHDAEAEHHFRRALALRPGYPLAQLDLSCLLLAQGRFAEGWRLHESRHDPALTDNGIAPPDLPLPAWRGEPLTGRSLLVWPEQGLGDQIQFCRYVPGLKALGAIRITLVCQRPLQALFKTLSGVDAVVAADVVDNAFAVDPDEIASHDCWTFPLSVPTHVGTDLQTLPEGPSPYLAAPVDRVVAWRARLRPQAAAFQVGLVWRGNPRHHNDSDRSLPGLPTLAPLWEVPGVRFVSLQTGQAGLTAQPPPDGQPLLHLGGALTNFADTAAALACLDLLICVDTSIAHLAGAMARPCWVLLPQHRTDWRWLRDRQDSPWYPSMRLFRQAERGHWGPVIDDVKTALAAQVGAFVP